MQQLFNTSSKIKEQYESYQIDSEQSPSFVPQTPYTTKLADTNEKLHLQK